MLHRQSMELPGPAIFVQRSKRKLRKAALPQLFSACAEGTLKLVIAKAMTKLDGAPAESSAVHRQSFRAR